MRASGIIRGYVVHGMTVRTAFGVETGVTLADSGGATLVTPRAAKILFPGEHDKETLVGLGQVKHTVETFKANISVRVSGGEIRRADVTVGIIPVVKEKVAAFALNENKVKAAVTKFLRDREKIEEL